MSSKTTSKPSNSRHSKTAQDIDEVHFGELLADLWEGRYLVLGCAVALLMVGGFLTWRSAPVYQADGLLQLHAKKPLSSDPAFAKMEGLFSESSDATAEVEILKSDLVLGRAAKALKLDVSAQPKRLPLVGEALARGKADAPAMKVGVLQVPERLSGKAFQISVLPDGTFRWSSPAGESLATGKPGELVPAVLEGEILKLKVESLKAKPGQIFYLVRRPLASVISDLRKGFEAAEKGKLTNVIGVTYKDTNPVRCAEVLNEIVNQYVRYKLEKKAGDADQTRSLLEKKIVPLKAELDASESKLNQFRSRFGSVDLSREAESLLLQSANYSSQVSALEQKKQEALRTYRENSDVVTTINQQIQKLKEDASRVAARVQTLPSTQQEVVRLSRDVQVNNDLYTALLNNIQQLQIAGAGDVGSVAVVDPATVNPDPIGAGLNTMLAFYATFGALVGVSLTILRQVLRSGIRDHRLIESKLGIPVLVTIPHSDEQEKHSEGIVKSKEGPHLLADQNPDCLAVESVRSLRTSLLFSMKDAKNNIIMVTGASPSVGKSFLCANLAILFAQTGARVLLVDADLRRGNLHRYFGLKSRLDGLSNVLSGRSEWRKMVHDTQIPGLHLMSTGIIPPDSSQLLLSPSFASLVGEISAAYDYVIFDTPPLLPVTDATIIGSYTGTVLLVAKFGKHSLDELRTCQQRAEDHGMQLTGCIFNDIVPTGLGYGYQDYRYAYHYKYK